MSGIVKAMLERDDKDKKLVSSLNGSNFDIDDPDMTDRLNEFGWRNFFNVHRSDAVPPGVMVVMPDMENVFLSELADVIKNEICFNGSMIYESDVEWPKDLPKMDKNKYLTCVSSSWDVKI